MSRTLPPGCRRWLDAIALYVDGDLEADLCRALEAHLQDCPDCRVLVDTVRQTVYLYRAAAREPVALPPDLHRRLFARLPGLGEEGSVAGRADAAPSEAAP